MACCKQSHAFFYVSGPSGLEQIPFRKLLAVLVQGCPVLACSAPGEDQARSWLYSYTPPWSGLTLGSLCSQRGLWAWDAVTQSCERVLSVLQKLLGCFGLRTTKAAWNCLYTFSMSVPVNECDKCACMCIVGGEVQNFAVQNCLRGPLFFSVLLTSLRIVPVSPWFSCLSINLYVQITFALFCFGGVTLLRRLSC